MSQVSGKLEGALSKGRMKKETMTATPHGATDPVRRAGRMITRRDGTRVYPGGSLETPVQEFLNGFSAWVHAPFIP